MSVATDPAPIPTIVSFPTGVVECRAWLDRKGFRPVEGERQHWVHPDGRHGRLEVKAWREAVLTITKENAVNRKHTPGPFYAKHNDPGWSIYGADGEYIGATVRKRNEGEEEGNAKLFAAAPALLDSVDPDTLEAIADEIDCFKHSARAAGLRLLAKQQRAAIAAATKE